MRDHIRREAMSQEINAAWFIVPMSVAAAALAAIALFGSDGRAEQPSSSAIAPVVLAPAPERAPEPPATQPLPEAVGHVQAF